MPEVGQCATSDGSSLRRWTCRWSTWAETDVQRQQQHLAKCRMYIQPKTRCFAWLCGEPKGREDGGSRFNFSLLTFVMVVRKTRGGCNKENEVEARKSKNKKKVIDKKKKRNRRLKHLARAALAARPPKIDLLPTPPRQGFGTKGRGRRSGLSAWAGVADCFSCYAKFRPTGKPRFQVPPQYASHQATRYQLGCTDPTRELFFMFFVFLQFLTARLGTVTFRARIMTWYQQLK